MEVIFLTINNDDIDIGDEDNVKFPQNDPQIQPPSRQQQHRQQWRQQQRHQHQRQHQPGNVSPKFSHFDPFSKSEKHKGKCIFIYGRNKSGSFIIQEDAPKSSFSNSRNNGSNNIKDTTGFLDDNIQGNIYSFVFKGVTIYHKLNAYNTTSTAATSTLTAVYQQQHINTNSGASTTAQSTKQ
ncbi:hypothetical protein ACTA71_000791 [Dictyostelium dimigraforme]